MNIFTTKGVLSDAWVLLKKHWVIVYGSLGIFLVLDIVSSNLAKDNDVAGFLASLVVGIIGVVLQLGLIRIMLDMVDGKPVTFSQLWSEYHHTIPFILATLAYGLAVVFGLVLLIVPGIIFAIMFSQYRYLIVDKKIGFYESLTLSKKITEGVKMQLFGFLLFLVVIVVISIIPFGLGLIISIPLVTLTGPILYRRLQVRYEGGHSTEPAPAVQDAPAPIVPLEGIEASPAPESSEPKKEE